MNIKKFTSLICLIITLLVVGITILINTTFSFAGSNGDENITINSYDVAMVVNDNNVCSVVETINVKFPSFGEKHGIYRYIPYEVNAKFVENGKIVSKKYGADIYNLTSNTKHKIFDEDGCAVIKLGSANSLVNGQTISYVITYDYSMGYDRDEQKDFLYYNLIGTNWSVPIANITYSVAMPKSFESDKVNLYYGSFGSELTTTPTINGKIISGEISSLQACEGLTIKVDLPNNYFSVNKINYNFDFIIVGITILIIAIILTIVLKSKRQHIVETVEVFAPSNLTPTDCAYYLNGKVRSKDITALIIYWANKGYLTIKAKDNETTLTKIKEMKDEKNYEINMFNKMFKNKSTIVVENEIDILASETVSAVSSVKTQCGNPRVDSESFKSYSLSLLLLFVPIIFMAIFYFAKMNLVQNILIYIIPLLIVFGLTAFSMVFTFSDLSRGTKEFCGKILTVLNLAVFALFILFMFKDRTLDKFGVSIFVVILTICGLFLCSKLLFFKPKINEKLGKILGFKNFLIKAEQQRMKVLLKDNPNYFFDVLSYAYVMDIESEFIKKFDKLLISSPEWLENGDAVNTYFVLSTLNNNFKNCNIKMNVVNMASKGSSISFGGNGGGGGFSGGGFGGGGGGSW